ncbi:MAG: hypothetical protein IKK76_02205 [Alphaproteobacteria bacterium]|nr:hypothetical protein [Alphaproteobacteria bacterium]
MKQEIYDIASAFITDKDVQISTFGFNGDIGYTFTKYGLADYPYCLTIFAEAKAPQKRREKYIEKHHGKINIKRGTASGDGYGNRTLTEYITEHEVGSALDKTQCDMKRFFTRIQSPKFFKIVNIAEKRILGQISTADNTAQLFNMIYRLKANQK